jgi:anaerobic magnesium-protoporphyrin IX monomethyl ester cyclase
MKVQLIRPPMNDWYTVSQLRENTSYPVGLCILSKKLKENGADVEIIDGYGKTMPELLKKVGGADLIGTTCLYSNYENALQVLEYAKHKGARTVIGGPNVTHLASRILTNRPYVDFAVVNDGEEALPQIALGKAGINTPNLVYRNERGEVTKSPIRKNAPLTTIFDLEEIVDRNNWRPQSVPVSGIRGCLKANLADQCDFCSIDHCLKVMDPRIMWEQARVMKGYGFEYLWEVGETAFPGYLNSLLKARPKDMSDIKWKFYMCADLIDEPVARTLKELGTKEIQIGIETPNDEILQRIGKSARAEDIYRALESVSKYGIDVHGTAMYGLTGETPKTAQRTFEFTQELIKRYPNLVKMTTSHAIPFFGTAMFKRLAKNPSISAQYSGDLHKDDTFNYRELTELYIKNFTSVGMDLTEGLVDRTRSLMNQKGQGTSFDVNPKNNLMTDPKSKIYKSDAVKLTEVKR